jgi:signal transduction histidine kinase
MYREMKVQPSPPPRCGEISPSHSSKIQNVARKIFILKVLVSLSLVFASLICGLGSYYIFRAVLVQRQRSEFSAVAKQFNENLFVSAVNIENSLSSIADFIGMYCPDPSQWPLCSLQMSSYNEITTPLVTMANGRAIGFAPIIKTSEIPAFENLTYGLYESEGYTNIGYSSFGKGIYYVENNTRYRALNVTAGKKQILAPIQLIADLSNNLAAPMYDLHSSETRAEALEGVIDCFQEYGRQETCIYVTDIIHLVQDPKFRPAVLVVYPLNPANAPSEIVAFTYFVVNWDTLLTQALPSYIDSVDAVLSNDRGQVHTFRISNGIVSYRGRGDQHDDRYSDLKSTYNIISSRYSIKYSVSLYPTNTFMTQYSTVNPIVTSVVSFSVVLLTSIIFFVYDSVMNKDADEKALVNNTKRLFVRFISHEIRTPLNTVHLGIKLFIQDISTMLRELDVEITPPQPIPQSTPIQLAPFLEDGVHVQRNNADLKEREQPGEEEKKSEELSPLPQDLSEITRKLGEWIDLTKDIESSSDSAILVLNDLINYDKISIGGLKLEISEVNLWTITQRAVAALELQGRQANISLTLDMELMKSAAAMNPQRLETLTKLCLLGDEIKLSQVVRNLVSNAIKFTPYGGSVAVSCEPLPSPFPTFPFFTPHPSFVSPISVLRRPAPGATLCVNSLPEVLSHSLWLWY